jgi:hypothetical protein
MTAAGDGDGDKNLSPLFSDLLFFWMMMAEHDNNDG